MARIEQLPLSLQGAIADMLREPRRYRVMQDLALAAQMSTRAVFRHLKMAGFSSPRRLVASARILRAYFLLCDTGRSVQDVADRLGYHSPDQLSQHMVALAGCTASDVKKGVPVTDFTDAIMASLLQLSPLGASPVPE